MKCITCRSPSGIRRQRTITVNAICKRMRYRYQIGCIQRLGVQAAIIGTLPRSPHGITPRGVSRSGRSMLVACVIYRWFCTWPKADRLATVFNAIGLGWNGKRNIRTQHSRQQTGNDDKIMKPVRDPRIHPNSFGPWHFMTVQYSHAPMKNNDAPYVFSRIIRLDVMQLSLP